MCESHIWVAYVWTSYDPQAIAEGSFDQDEIHEIHRDERCPNSRQKVAIDQDEWQRPLTLVSVKKAARRDRFWIQWIGFSRFVWAFHFFVILKEALEIEESQTEESNGKL